MSAPSRTPHQDFLSVRKKGDARCCLAIVPVGGVEMTCIANTKVAGGVASFEPLFVHIDDVRRLIESRQPPTKPAYRQTEPVPAEAPAKGRTARKEPAPDEVAATAACTGCGLHAAALDELGCPMGGKPVDCIRKQGS